MALVADPAGQGTVEQVQQGIGKAGRALQDAGYAVDEIQPPAIDAAVKTALDMLNPDWHLWWQFMSQSMPADTKRYMMARFGAVGDPDPLTTVLSYMSRQSLLGALGEFQEEHPLIVAPISTDLPSEVARS